jgi:signal transduction histidine kinase
LLVSDPALTEADPGLVAAVGSVAGLALENSRLTAEVRAQLEDVRASRARIVEAGDAERRRVERDLHDGAQQRLVTLAVRLQLGRDALGDEADPATARLLDAASAELDNALAQLRELARGIHPAILAEAGLGPAIRSLAERSAVPVRVTASDERSPTRVETAAYYVVAEALTNVVRYAAASEATVSVERSDGVLLVRVADDGVGGADPERGSGLRGLEDRVAAVGGTLTVTSPPHAGTTILAEFPNA